jgi:hypothetical protein
VLCPAVTPDAWPLVEADVPLADPDDSDAPGREPPLPPVHAGTAIMNSNAAEPR